MVALHLAFVALVFTASAMSRGASFIRRRLSPPDRINFVAKKDQVTEHKVFDLAPRYYAPTTPPTTAQPRPLWVRALRHQAAGNMASNVAKASPPTPPTTAELFGSPLTISGSTSENQPSYQGVSMAGCLFNPISVPFAHGPFGAIINANRALGVHTIQVLSRIVLPSNIALKFGFLGVGAHYVGVAMVGYGVVKGVTWLLDNGRPIVMNEQHTRTFRHDQEGVAMLTTTASESEINLDGTELQRNNEYLPVNVSVASDQDSSSPSVTAGMNLVGVRVVPCPFGLVSPENATSELRHDEGVNLVSPFSNVLVPYAAFLAFLAVMVCLVHRIRARRIGARSPPMRKSVDQAMTTTTTTNTNHNNATTRPSPASALTPILPLERRLSEAEVKFVVDTARVSRCLSAKAVHDLLQRRRILVTSLLCMIGPVRQTVKKLIRAIEDLPSPCGPVNHGRDDLLLHILNYISQAATPMWNDVFKVSDMRASIIFGGKAGDVSWVSFPYNEELQSLRIIYLTDVILSPRLLQTRKEEARLDCDMLTRIMEEEVRATRELASRKAARDAWHKGFPLSLSGVGSLRRAQSADQAATTTTTTMSTITTDTQPVMHDEVATTRATTPEPRQLCAVDNSEVPRYHAQKVLHDMLTSRVDMVKSNPAMAAILKQQVATLIKHINDLPTPACARKNGGTSSQHVAGLSFLKRLETLPSPFEFLMKGAGTETAGLLEAIALYLDRVAMPEWRKVFEASEKRSSIIFNGNHHQVSWVTFPFDKDMQDVRIVFVEKVLLNPRLLSAKKGERLTQLAQEELEARKELALRLAAKDAWQKGVSPFELSSQKSISTTRQPSAVDGETCWWALSVEGPEPHVDDPN